MLFPRSRLEPGQPQVIYDGPNDGLGVAEDARVRQFVEGRSLSISDL
jgi:phospholipid/cholesterol/gamma-HCH transport system ATP-binding protein